LTHKALKGLENQHILILGTKQSGKTHLAKYWASQVPNHLVYDVHKEYNNYNQLIPDHQSGEKANKDLETFINRVIKPKKHKLDLLVLDEINRYTPKAGYLEGGVGECVSWGSSHWNMNILYIARRPATVNTNIREQADYIFVFNLKGANDMKWLDNTSAGLSEDIKSLSGHEFIRIGPQRDYKKFKPVPSL